MINRLRQRAVRTSTAVWEIFTGESGASMVEYGMLIALIALVAFASVVLFGNAVTAQWGDSADSIIKA